MVYQPLSTRYRTVRFFFARYMVVFLYLSLNESYVRSEKKQTYVNDRES